ncbi:MAG TPA: PQQ-binding-like beta-propeller repeat protein, partial [Pirellulales bacterium]|nr:PQQ-binding-like beta-propeller repeat protein [Pirellulales bacterium]
MVQTQVRMNFRRWAVRLLLTGLAWPATGQFAPAQGPVLARFELSDAVQVDEADAAARTHLEQVKALLANQQWDEAVETLRQVTENHGGKVLAVSPWRFISVRDYCHLQIASLPGEALKLYRDRVDAQARGWYEAGVRQRESELLERVVDQLFCSSWGDDALLALGDLALERGELGKARGAWEKILPPEYWSRRTPAVQADGSGTWLIYPDSDLDMAGVRARRVLAIIMAGEDEVARRELQEFTREFGVAEGRLGGRQVRYADFLANLIDESGNWPPAASNGDWPTFAGSPDRNRVAPRPAEVSTIIWKVDLPPTPPAELDYNAPRRVAEKRDQLLSYHPIIVGQTVLVAGQDEIRAFDLHSGRPVWGDGAVIYPDDPLLDADEAAMPRLRKTRTAGAGFGAPRFTLTAHNDRLYARLGNPVTSSPHEVRGRPEQGYLVCLDLKEEGSKRWSRTPDDASWAFEGSPVTDGGFVYVGMRRSGVRPQAFVACFDAERGRLRWRKFVCAAETPAQGQYEELTHNLLTLAEGIIYYNTNLGAVAALDARDGQIKWITRYQRAKTVDLASPAKHFYRDLNPCVYHRGWIYVAPSDSRDILAFDAPTGMPLRWEPPLAEDAVHLLGVSHDRLMASGDRLRWIDVLTGKSTRDPFPAQGSPQSLGRGLLVGDKVYWPTWDKIYVFDQKTDRQEEAIELAARGA